MGFYIGLALFLSIFIKLKRYNRALYTFLFILLVIISGCRAYSVGTDTSNYLNMFLGREVYSFSAVEISWYFLMEILPSYRIVLLISSILILFPIFYVSKRESINPYHSILLFVLLYYYCYSFNITRQFVANSMLMLSFYFFIRKHSFKAILFAIFAVTFHLSALIPLLFFPLTKIKYNYKLFILLILVTYVIGLSNLVPQIIPYLTWGPLNTYDIYIENLQIESSFSISRLLLNFLVIIQIVLLKYKSPYFNLVLIGCILTNLLSFSSVAGRLFHFFLMAQIIIIPNIPIDCIKKYNKLLHIACQIYAWAIFIYLLYNNVGEITPYSFSLQ